MNQRGHDERIENVLSTLAFYIIKDGLLGEGQNPTLANCWFWLSEYGPTPHVPVNWSTWTLWQYTDGSVGPEPHSVSGVGNCDRDQFNGTMDELTRLWGYAT